MREQQARRAQLAADVAHFRDPESGAPMLQAASVHRRCVADLFYLSRVRLVGQASAGAETCGRFGHERAGAACLRCGIQVR